MKFNLQKLKGLKPENAKAIILLTAGLVAIVLIVWYVNKAFGSFSNFWESIFGNSADKLAKSKAIADAASAAALSSSPWNGSFYENSPNGTSISDDQASSIASDIYDSVNWLTGSDTTKLMAALKRIQYQVDLSLVSEKFSESYNKDLYSWLTSRFGNTLLSVGRTDPMSDVNNYIGSIPKYY